MSWLLWAVVVFGVLTLAAASEGLPAYRSRRRDRRIFKQAERIRRDFS